MTTTVTRRLAAKTLALLTLFAAGALALQETPELGAPEPQHEWLQQLVGEWTATAVTTLSPDIESMTMESTESVRSIGGLWILAEGSAEYLGAPFTSIMTLGYDPAQDAFVGTWIDSVQTHMWSYHGKLDESKRILTLDTEGPSFDDPSRMARYRDVIEVKAKNHKVLTSSLQADDGTWTTFMKADYRRKE